MPNKHSDDQNKLLEEIHEHSQKGIDFFKEGQAIHENYLRAPDEQNLTQEVDSFVEKVELGTAELQKAQELQKGLIDEQRKHLEETPDDLKME